VPSVALYATEENSMVMWQALRKALDGDDPVTSPEAIDWQSNLTGIDKLFEELAVTGPPAVQSQAPKQTQQGQLSQPASKKEEKGTKQLKPALARARRSRLITLSSGIVIRKISGYQKTIVREYRYRQ
jgi:hypothetical protein